MRTFHSWYLLGFVVLYILFLPQCVSQLSVTIKKKIPKINQLWKRKYIFCLTVLEFSVYDQLTPWFVHMGYSTSWRKCGRGSLFTSWQGSERERVEETRMWPSLFLDWTQGVLGYIPSPFLILYLRKGLTKWPRLSLNLKYSSLSLLSSWNYKHVAPCLTPQSPFIEYLQQSQASPKAKLLKISTITQ